MFDYPREIKDNLIYRYKLMEMADRDIELRSALKEYCKRDILFFVNVFLFTYDPRRTFYDGIDLPFVLFPAQEKFVLDIKKAIDDQTDIALEKSRDEGATWMALAVLAWYWNFVRGGSSLIGSINEDMIHLAGKMGSLFPKLFYMIRMLPKWLRPQGYTEKEHANHMRLVNPELNNSITGQSPKNFGTGDRVRVAFLDEFSKWDSGADDQAWESVQQATKCRIAVGTPRGQYGTYYRIVHNTGSAQIRKSRIHWSDDPRKTKDLEYIECNYSNFSACPAKNEKLYKKFKGKRRGTPAQGFIPTSSWYRDECQRMMTDPDKGDKGIKQELDVYYVGTGQTYFNQEMIEEKKALCREPIAKGDLEFLTEPILVNNKYNYEPEVYFKEDSAGDCWIWEYPVDDPFDNHYAFSCDPAKGSLNSDYTAIKVLNRETREVVFTYHARTEESAFYVYKVWLFYDKAGSWAIDGTGNSDVAIIAERLGVRLLARINQETGEVKAGKGFNFDRTSKGLIFKALNNSFRSNDFYDPDIRVYMQANTFVRDNGVLKGAGKGELQSHDDLIDCEALLMYADNNMSNVIDERTERNLKVYKGTYQEHYKEYSTRKSSIL